MQGAQQRDFIHIPKSDGNFSQDFVQRVQFLLNFLLFICTIQVKAFPQRPPDRLRAAPR
jgi:hypothetical protein